MHCRNCYFAWLLWWFLSMGLPATVCSQPTVEIRLASAAMECPHSLIRIQDVADVALGPSTARAKIEQLDLAQFDSHDQPVTISASQIRYRLILAGLQDREFHISGNSQVVVSRALSSSIKLMLQQALASQLSRQFQIHQDDIQITVDNDPTTALRKAGLDLNGLNIQAHFGTEIPIGNVQIETVFGDRGGGNLTIEIPANIAIMRKLAMAKSNISRGQVLTAELVEHVRRPVDNRQIQYASYEQTVGRTASQNIQPFSLIQTPFLQETVEVSPAAIKRNDLVTAIVNSGAIRVQLRNAIALENGRIGDVIQIKNPQSNRILKGRILDPSTVEISH